MQAETPRVLELPPCGPSIRRAALAAHAGGSRRGGGARWSSVTGVGPMAQVGPRIGQRELSWLAAAISKAGPSMLPAGGPPLGTKLAGGGSNDGEAAPARGERTPHHREQPCPAAPCRHPGVAWRRQRPATGSAPRPVRPTQAGTSSPDQTRPKSRLAIHAGSSARLTRT